MKKLLTLASLLAVASLALAACGSSAAPASDLLGAIQKRGYVLVSTDPNYEPQSFLNTEGKRAANTKCPSDALTADEMQGFDVDVAKAVGEALGVETCFATPDWDMITAGNWANKWDLSVGSMTITTSRQKVLDFSVPYYYTPAVIAVSADSGYSSLADLAGQPICAPVSTTYEAWLNNDMEALGLPDSSIYAHAPEGLTIIPLPTDQECAQAIAAGRKDFSAYMTSETVIDANIAAGMPVVKLDGVAFSEDLAAAFDKSSSLDTTSLREKVNELFTAMHKDGRLTKLSDKWFGADLTVAPNQ
ncbi:MAG: transporter substrate-binding domain-containing protein [Anaerolineales bacterium]|nr:transporter substrate-binding domain-containing protein [Anaerolineales bacterium]